ncbi:MAG: ATPase, T2SS/T4P/T4SS family [Acidimicrobiia bacterium]
MTLGPRSAAGVAARNDETRARIHRRLIEGGVPPEEDRVREALAEMIVAELPLLGGPERAALLDELVHEALGLGPLEAFLADPCVTEVMVLGTGRVYVERDGRIEPVPVSVPAPVARRVVERVLAPLGLRLDRSSPIVDARLPDGARLHAVIPPLAIDGPCVTIRRFAPRPLSLDDFDVSGPAARFLHEAVHTGWNLVVSGGTSTGKTTLLNVLAGAMPCGARVVTIEETAELAFDLPHVVRLEARPPNAEGRGAVTVRELVRTSLRMRPDRLIIGEVRGPEAFDMVQAMNTGHAGSLCTVHANSAPDAMVRIETLVLLAGAGLPLDAVRAQLVSAIDGVVHVRRIGGRRIVATIGELRAAAPHGLEVHPLYHRTPAGLVATGARARRGPGAS